MKKLIILFLVFTGLNSYSQMSISDTEKLIFESDSMMCLANQNLLSLFNSWDKGTYKSSIELMELSAKNYSNLSKKGTYKISEKQEWFVKYMNANNKVAEASIKLYGSEFVSLMKSDSPKQTIEYNGTTYSYSKYTQEDLKRIIQNIKTYCK